LLLGVVLLFLVVALPAGIVGTLARVTAKLGNR